MHLQERRGLRRVGPLLRRGGRPGRFLASQPPPVGQEPPDRRSYPGAWVPDLLLAFQQQDERVLDEVFEIREVSEPGAGVLAGLAGQELPVQGGSTRQDPSTR